MAKRRNTSSIINNNFNSVEVDTRKINFVPLNGYSRGIDEDIHYKELYHIVKDMLDTSLYAYLNVRNKDTQKWIKLNKNQINEVYTFVVSSEKIKKYSKIDIFSTLLDIYDIDYEKFFTSLSNIFKDELLNELDKKHKIKHNPITKLF